MFDSYMDENDVLQFGSNCASYDEDTQTLIMDGAVVWDEEDECYMVVIS